MKKRGAQPTEKMPHVTCDSILDLDQTPRCFATLPFLSTFRLYGGKREALNL